MIYSAAEKLIDYSVRNEIITSDDVFVARNLLIDALGLADWQDRGAGWESESIDDLLSPIIEYAVESGIISDTANSRDLFDTRIMGLLTPMPREVIATFREKYNVSPAEATDWYFDFSKKLNYVRAGRIAKDLVWTYDSEYGTLDITINRSKPEKDPRDIAAARAQKATSYPKCQLCAENAGFAGHSSHPARQNLRPVPLTVGGEDWQIQYSPYGYYNEHCIVFNVNHIPMKIDDTVFGKLFDIVDYLPHYFVGSNADLPIVGGSILSHEHFQGGNYTFAMARAEVEREFSIPAYPSVKAGVVKWPMSVVRVSSSHRAELEACCAEILKKWRAYSDEEAGIFAFTDGTPHNTITPIARKVGEVYECDLVLRNNLTTEERPLGVFHPNPSLHHIKKENIGLIEVMGLAVLPARLAKEIVLLEDAMLSGGDLDATPELSQHAEWAREILVRYPDFSKDNARAILEHEIGRVFLDVLLDAGVYKRDESGKTAFARFTYTLSH